MPRYFKSIDPRTNSIRVYDGCGCYDDKFSCWCGDCYYYGPDYCNCYFAGDFSGDPVKWDPELKKWVADV